MINEILKYYENSIPNLTWLSIDTKEKALTKIKNIAVNIGLGNDYPKYNYNLSSNKTLIENIISIMKTQSDYGYQRLIYGEKIF